MKRLHLAIGVKHMGDVINDYQKMTIKKGVTPNRLIHWKTQNMPKTEFLLRIVCF
jgi:hypothetical protein